MARHRAPQVCAQPGCPNLRPCPTHQRKPWANAKQRRPGALTGSALQTRNRRIIARDHGLCGICGMPEATQVDHIVPLAEGGSDEDHNLRAVHPACHRIKSQREAARGRQTPR